MIVFTLLADVMHPLWNMLGGWGNTVQIHIYL